MTNMNFLPEGFLSTGIHSGIKKKKVKDLALIYSKTPAVAAGVFTRNIVKAAPVIYSQNIIKKNKIHTIIINSGCANACTGKMGLEDVRIICNELAKALGVHKNSVIMASTGVIGERLPVKNIKKHIPELNNKLSKKGLGDAARAIMTTDKIPKIATKKIKINNSVITLTGFAKGAGMIQPNMATMLAFILTDAEVSNNVLLKTLKKAVDISFNRITVDGDMSTNDTVIAVANGAGGTKIEDKEEIAKFQEALNQICLKLSEMIVADGEGATHLVKIEVDGARTLMDAKKIAYKIGNSPLVKTAIYGKNPNCGRIMASAGSAEVDFNPEIIDIYFDNVRVVKNGVITHNDSRAKKIMEKKEYTIRINLNSGNANFSILTTDLTYEYISINASYKS